MKLIVLAMSLLVALSGCTEQEKTPPAKPAMPATPAADLAAGRLIAERDCQGCHRLDGGSAAPAIPILAGQREAYLLASLQSYKAGKRIHAALRDLTGHMNETDLRNVSAYFASLPPVQSEIGKDAQMARPMKRARHSLQPAIPATAQTATAPHPALPALAGQQPRYLVVATQEYLHGERSRAPMHMENYR